jgi:glutathione S-transferase
MKLFYAPRTISIAAAITLEESGLEYQTQMLDFSKGEQQGAAYIGINPKGRVPALVIGDMILTETGAILEYIATQVPGLMPDDPLAAAHARSVMYYLASTMHVNHAHKLRGSRWADSAESWADMTAKVPETMTASAAHIEAKCLAGPYILGDRFCVADAYLFQVCTWLEGDGVDTAQFPNIERLIDSMQGRASVQTLRARGMIR